MKDYKVCVKTTFLKWYKVSANSEQEAIDKTKEIIEDDDATDTDIFETEITEVL